MSECLSQQALRAYLTDSLELDEKDAAEAHLSQCELCQETLSKEADDSAFQREYLKDNLRDPIAAVSADHDSTIIQYDSTITHLNEKTHVRFLGRYRVEELLGRGGIGEVWRGFDPHLKRYVAIKTRRRDRATGGRFLEEARALASLKHEGIVDIYDSGEEGNEVFIVTELLAGGNLQERLQCSPMTIREGVELVIKVARAVQAAHDVGFVHRDIKPSNVILDANGVPRLADFGLAVPIMDLLRIPEAREGTIPYMSPEQAAGDQMLGFASDIYSLGVVYYELLTGTVPHHGTSTLQTQQLIQFEAPAPPRGLNHEIPETLERICLRCLQKVPSERYDSAAALADELTDWLRSTAPTIERHGDVLPRSQAGRFRLSRRAAVSTLAAGTLGALGLCAWPLGTRVRVVTRPAGARVVVYPIDATTGLPDGSRRAEAWNRSPAMLSLSPGFYLVVVALDEHRFHEVFRTVPVSAAMLPSEKRHLFYANKGAFIEWHEIEIPLTSLATQLMGYYPGSPSFAVGIDGNQEAPEHKRKIPAFYLDPHEATLADCRKLYSGQLLPGIAGRKDLPPDDHAMAHVWWDDAVGYAERKGLRLPSEAEFEFAATNGGTTRFPWGNSARNLTSWPFGPAGEPLFDQSQANRMVYGLYSNVPEWTSTQATYYPQARETGAHAAVTSDEFIVRGAPASVLEDNPIPAEFEVGPRVRISQHRKSPAPIGFRCARSARPRLYANDLERIVEQTGRDPK